MEMEFVPSGEFTMGSSREMAAYARKLCIEFSGENAIATCKASAFVNEQPAHQVKVGAFWIDKTEVSNGQYQKCVEAGKCAAPLLNTSFSRSTYYGDLVYQDYPVINIEWSMASAYCTWAGGKLPTEAQWEYAARGPESLIYPWGNTFERDKLNYCDINCGALSDAAYDDGHPDTAPVGSYPSGASWVGALDMAGNVREWVSDWYGPYSPADVENPAGPEVGESKIPRGGSWYDTPDDTRSTNRGSELLDYYRHNLGFRCAKEDR
jgi:formylglycine-generating enzyme required for sulfatase activity